MTGHRDRFVRANAAAEQYAMSRDFEAVLKNSGMRRGNLVDALRRRGLIGEDEYLPCKRKPPTKRAGAAVVANLHFSPIDRAPCFRCGVRGDHVDDKGRLGCIHNRVAA